MINIHINGSRIQTILGKTILAVARENNIDIPTFCHHIELGIVASCRICAVKVVGKPTLMMACSTRLEDGMEIWTETAEVLTARRNVLRMLMSEHYADCLAPCRSSCPANIDVQSYIASVANGNYHEAIAIIKEKLPMPLSIGHICLAFCESECRNTLIGDTIPIREIKKLVAELDMSDHWQWEPEKHASNGKMVAIVGAGPSGLTCGYYLSYLGYLVDIFESMPESGGWLRYGIPTFRLPKETLSEEIDLMCAGGMNIHHNHRLGVDIQLDDLSVKYDAVYLAIGAEKAVDMPLPGSDLENVYLGVDFLKKVAMGDDVHLGEKTAIIGGGNTAIDCARTALRLGSEVTVIYRRTRAEMPADEHEIIAAEKEGVRFWMLTNPVEYAGNENLEQIVLEVMELEEPDSSGRRRPVGTGKYRTHKFDSVIAAISQVPDISFLDNQSNKINITKWSTAVSDEHTMFTGVGNIFAGGDFRKGPSTAVEAIADGRRAATYIDKFLNNITLEKPKYSFAIKKASSIKKLSRGNDYQYDFIQDKLGSLEQKKVTSPMTPIEYIARKSATACLECGCFAFYTCKLREYASRYNVTIDPDLFTGKVQAIDESHPYITRDNNKCIKCGCCVRACNEIAGKSVFTFAFRGHDTIITPSFQQNLGQTDCDNCGKCIYECPAGALVSRNTISIRSPRTGNISHQDCGLCGLGCRVAVETSFGRVLQVTAPLDRSELSFNDTNICHLGLYGWQKWEEKERILQPMKKIDGKWQVVSAQTVIETIRKKLTECQSRYAFISLNSSLEEILLYQEIQRKLGFHLHTFKYVYNDIESIKPNKLLNAECIVIVGELNQVLRAYCNLAKRDNQTELVYLKTDADYEKLPESIYGKKTTFIIDEASLLWKISEYVKDISEGFDIILNSPYANSHGMKRSGITFCADDFIENAFVISHRRSRYELVKENNFHVVVHTHWEPAIHDIADIFIPLSTYLEMEAHCINIFGDVVEYTNPKNSNLFHQLLNIYYESGLIAPSLAEPSVWNMKAESFLEDRR
jgi:formate dehydrogenase major subunit